MSDEWVADKIEQATNTGYVELAFGGRLRTPILKQTILGNRNTPYEAKQESRTAGNALGQSYGMMCNRAAIEMQQRVLASKYALDIKPVCMIHDALYFLIKDTVGCVAWFNKNLTECMAWQELEAIQHDTVKISASVDLFYPNWSTSIGLPNNSTMKQILDICKKEYK